jgi:hypothetical protein
MKIKTLKPKNQILLKIKCTTFCQIHTKIPLVIDGKVPQRAHHSVLSPSIGIISGWVTMKNLIYLGQ